MQPNSQSAVTELWCGAHGVAEYFDMRSPKFNAEQAEANEIDAVPRVVVTAKEIYVFPHPERPINLSKEQTLSLMSIMRTLARKKL